MLFYDEMRTEGAFFLDVHCAVRSCCFVLFGCSCLFDVGRVATNFIKISNLIVKKGMEKKTTKLVFPKQRETVGSRVGAGHAAGDRNPY